MSENKQQTIDTIDPQTGQGWRFKNRLFEFGQQWLNDIDRKVAKGETPAAIHGWLKEKYNGSLPIPALRTVQAYVKWKKQSLRVSAGAAVRIRKETERTEVELKEMLSRLQVAEADVTDRKALLETMVRFLLVRTERLSQVQENLFDPRFEQAITNHLALVKTTVDSLAKLEGQSGMQEFIARRFVEMFLADLAPLIKRVAEEVYGPEKLKTFLQRLSKEYAAIDFVRIRRDATAEAAAIGTQEVIDAVSAVRPNAG